jgi:hypothetical protein
MQVAGDLRHIISIYPDAIPDVKSVLQNCETAIHVQTMFAGNVVCGQGGRALQTAFVACIAGGDAWSPT